MTRMGCRRRAAGGNVQIGVGNDGFMELQATDFMPINMFCARESGLNLHVLCPSEHVHYDLYERAAS